MTTLSSRPHQRVEVSRSVRRLASWQEWKQAHIMPQEDAGKPAKELLKKQFARRMWVSWQ